MGLQHHASKCASIIFELAFQGYITDNIHQAFNNSDKTMEFLFLDVKMNTEVEL